MRRIIPACVIFFAFNQVSLAATYNFTVSESQCILEPWSGTTQTPDVWISAPLQDSGIFSTTEYSDILELGRWDYEGGPYISPESGTTSVQFDFLLSFYENESKIGETIASLNGTRTLSTLWTTTTHFNTPVQVDISNGEITATFDIIVLPEVGVIWDSPQDYSVQLQADIIPEPATLLLLGLGTVMLGRRKSLI